LSIWRPWEIWLGTRYLRSTHRRGFVSFVAGISVIGLMLGVAVLIVVLSVMNGFERELRSRMLAVTSHATLMGLEGTLNDWQNARELALQTPGVTHAVPYIESQAMIARGSRVLGVGLRGVDPVLEREATGLAERLVEGDFALLEAGKWNVVIGVTLAKELALKLGDQLVLIVPEGSVTPEGVVPRMRRLTVAGVFDSGMYEFDRGLVLMHLADAARLLRMQGEVSGLRLALTDPLEAPSRVREIALALGGGYFISDWTRNHANFFQSIELTKGLLFIILSIIVGVAAFNIVSTLVMIVKEKSTDIATLRTLGASPASILASFATQGVLIGLIGTVAGVLLGVGMASQIESIVGVIEGIFDIQFLNAEVYFMSDLPAEVIAQDLWRVSLVAFSLCAMATIYPAWRAARMQPAEVLRHD
jgi:lipoprotein-releasing system permease protein